MSRSREWAETGRQACGLQDRPCRWAAQPGANFGCPPIWYSLNTWPVSVGREADCSDGERKKVVGGSAGLPSIIRAVKPEACTYLDLHLQGTG